MATPARGTAKKRNHVGECVEVDNDLTRWLNLWVSPRGRPGLGKVSQESLTQPFKINILQEYNISVLFEKI